jgi:hypothetical protein
VLPIGGVSPIDARRQLETIRSQEADPEEEGEDDAQWVSSNFAIELAHIVEFYGNRTQDDIMIVLKLFLEGAKSIMLAVAYAQRARSYSAVLWDTLIDHCLSPSVSGDGASFGELLEAAALSGADLAKLVTKIPPGMVVEGLRPRLVAAVADYRLMVDIHKAASEAAAQDEVSLIREVEHRSRRGARFLFSGSTSIRHSPVKPAVGGECKVSEENEDEKPTTLDINFRPVERKSQHGFFLALPLR